MLTFACISSKNKQVFLSPDVKCLCHLFCKRVFFFLSFHNCPQTQATISSAGFSYSLSYDIANGHRATVWSILLMLGCVVLLCQVSVFFLKTGNNNIPPAYSTELVSKFNENICAILYTHIICTYAFIAN